MTKKAEDSFAFLLSLIVTFHLRRDKPILEIFILDGALSSIVHPIRLTSFYYGKCVFACEHDDDMCVTLLSPSACVAIKIRGRRRVYA